MERSIRGAVAVVVVCCPSYKAKVESGDGFVAKELELAISLRRTCGLRILPVIAKGAAADAVPSVLADLRWVGLSSETEWFTGVASLVSSIKGIPLFRPAVLGVPVRPGVDQAELLRDLERALDTPDDGASVRRWIRKNPFALHAVRGYGRYHADIALGSVVDPDFVTESWGNYSVFSLFVCGPPNAQLFNADGTHSAELVRLLERIQSWQISDRFAHAEEATADLQMITRPDVGVQAYLLIGRRARLGTEGRRRLADANRMGMQLVVLLTYDEVLSYLKGLSPQALAEIVSQRWEEAQVP